MRILFSRKILLVGSCYEDLVMRILVEDIGCRILF